MRVFFAVVPSKPTLEKIAAVADVLRRRARSDDIRWVLPEQLHFTVKFLGEQSEERVAEAILAGRKAALACAAFELSFGGLGAFPHVARPRVVWLGVSAGGAPFGELARKLDRELSKIGFEPESRPYVPHLTLARTKSREGEREAARLLESAGETVEIASERVENFVLMQSKLSPKGSEYTVLETFPLPQIPPPHRP